MARKAEVPESAGESRALNARRWRRERPPWESMSSSEPIRLQKFIAESGACSRRAAEILIAQGDVWVNGKAALAGQKVTPGVDKVVVSGKVVRSAAQPRLTLAVNKPRGLVCSNDDPHNPDTIFDLLPRELGQPAVLLCAGRLDKDSEGLVILTTDGDLAHRLMHPSNEVVKRYHVVLKEKFPSTQLPRLLKGVMLEGERLRVERAALVNAGADGSADNLDVHMNHGKKREIRQLFGLLGYEVKRLKRYQIGSVPLKGIPLRAVKQLSMQGIEMLFRSPRPRPAPFSTSVPPRNSTMNPPATCKACSRVFGWLAAAGMAAGGALASPLTEPTAVQKSPNASAPMIATLKAGSEPRPGR